MNLSNLFSTAKFRTPNDQAGIFISSSRGFILKMQLVCAAVFLLACQAAIFAQATLPIPTFTGGKASLPTGFSHTGLGSDYSASDTKLKFDNAGDKLIINFTGTPGTLSYRVKGNSGSAAPTVGTFLVEESIDGLSYSPLRTITDAVSANTDYSDALDSASQYVRFTYTVKTTGNIGLGTIALSSALPAGSPAISTITPDVAASGASVTITGTNLESPTSVVFTTANGTAEATVTSNSTTEIVCTVPVGAITGDVTVTTANGSASVPFRSLNPITVPYDIENFETSQGAWFTYNGASTQNWGRTTASGSTNFFMEINNYTADVAADDWLILGPLNIPVEAVNLVADFVVQRAYPGNENEVEFKYSTDYSGIGDPSSSTWTSVSFGKPAIVTDPASTTFSPSNASLPASLAGQSGVYIAFHSTAATSTSGGSSRWRIDDFKLISAAQPIISVTSSSGTLAEGQTANGTVTLPSAALADTIVTVSSADGTEILVNGAVTTEVLIYEGFTSAEFQIQAQIDGVIDADESVQITAEATGYEFGEVLINVTNIDLEAASLPVDGYTQDFSTFTDGTLPIGWSATGPDLTYDGDWGTGTTGGFRGNATVSVFGYQHTSSTGILQQVLTLRNETGATLTDLTVSYTGRASRITEGRSPAYTVTLDGVPVAALAYSTADGDGQARTAAISGLSIPANAVFTIIWTSDRDEAGSGASKQIGISNVSVSAGASLSSPTVGGLTIPSVSVLQTTAQVSANVSSDGGSPITQRGFVYAESSQNPTPELGGVGVTLVPDASASVGPMTSDLTELTAGTGYSVRAFATNSEGTAYSSVQSFVTLAANLQFSGNYAQDFDAFTGTVPPSWTAISSGGVQSYVGDWGTGSAGGFLGNQTDSGVLGYQHISSTGNLTVTLRLINNTGGELTQLSISYLGRVARIDQTRTPAWEVSVNGTVVPELAYSTGNTAGPGGEPVDLEVSHLVTGLSIAQGEEFSITWVSSRGEGAGSSRQIGLADVVVSTSSSTASPVISGDLTLTGTVGTAITPYQITASGSPTSYGSGALPAGLTLNATTGIISGTPGAVAAGSQVEITATNGVGTGSANLTITIGRGTPSIVMIPTASAIEAGSALGSSSLTGGSASVPGAFAWTSPAVVPPVGTAEYGVTFTPTDSANYDAVTLLVSLTVDPANYEFSEWSGGAPLTDESLLDFAFGGASAPGGDQEAAETAIEGVNLVLTAVVRTNNTQLTITPEVSTSLTGGWSSEGITSSADGVDQTGVPAGCERRKFLVPMGTDSKKFLRLRAVLVP